MPGITLAQAEAQLQAYMAAELAVLGGQAYEIAGRRLTRADLTAIQQGISTWQQRVNELAIKSRGRGRARTVAVGF
jgi:orotidine-5'-phosphate decarboxylase